jgi:transposase-like protein
MSIKTASNFSILETPQEPMPDPKSSNPEKLPPSPPDPEVVEKPYRRRFTAEYKLLILQQADSCKEPGELGALLRREGLYSSNLTVWRRQRDEGMLAALKPKRRGRKPVEPTPEALENERLRKENERLSKRLQQAELIIEVQKKISQVLGIDQATPSASEDDWWKR